MDFEDYGLEDGKGYGPDVRELLMDVRMDLDVLTDGEKGCLEDHGYGLADVAARKRLTGHVELRRAGFSRPHPSLAGDEAARGALVASGRRGMSADVWKSIRERIRDLLSKGRGDVSAKR